MALQKYSEGPSKFWESVAECYPWKPGLRVLEIGGGTGEFWLRVINQVPDNLSIVFTDFSEGMLETAKKNLVQCPLNIDFKILDANNLNVPEESFDAALAHFMCYHLESPEKTFQNIHTLLSSDGWFGVVLPQKPDKFSSYLELAFEMNPELRESFMASSTAHFFSEDFQRIASELFPSVEVCELSGSRLKITEVDPIIEAVQSLPAFQVDGLEDFFEEYRSRLELLIQRDGAIFDSSKGVHVTVCSKNKL